MLQWIKHKYETERLSSIFQDKLSAFSVLWGFFLVVGIFLSQKGIIEPDFKQGFISSKLIIYVKRMRFPLPFL